MAMNRRQFIKTGIAGTALLATSAYLGNGTFWGSGSQRARRGDFTYRFLTEKDHQVLSAIVPVMLAGSLERAAGNSRENLESVIRNFDGAVSSFLPEVQKELRQLFSLLTLMPTRKFLAGVGPSWDKADATTIHRFLDSWHHSKRALFKTAYDALQQLTMGSWYGNRASWAQIGYPGPMQLG